MRFMVIVILGLHCCFIAGADTVSAVIKGDTLVLWPRDFNGVAVVPSNVRHIGDGAFAGSKLLTGVAFPQSIESIGQVAFMGCSRLREVQIPSSVTNIGCSAFDHCLSLTSLVVRAKIEKIAGSMCAGCFALRHVELPDGVFEIGDGAFYACRSIRSMRIPESVKRIGNSAFHGCCRMRSTVFPKNLQCIDKFAFSWCSDMKYLVVPPGLKHVGEDAFQNCFSLKGIIALGGVPNLDEGLLPNADVPYTIFAVGGGRDETCGSRHDFHVDYGKSLEESIARCEKQESRKPSDNVFEGLDRVLRIAAEGLLEDIADTNIPIHKLDSFVAHFPRLREMKCAKDIKEYLMDHATTSIDSGLEVTAYFWILNDISIIAEFTEERLTRISLSENLKNAVRKGLEVGFDETKNIDVDETVLKWLK